MDVIHRHLRKKCDTCPDRKNCTTLCPEVEAWVAQDYVPQRHELPGCYPMSVLSVDIEQNLINYLSLTETEEKVLTLLAYNVPRSKMAETLKISKQSIRTHLANIRKKARQIDRILTLFAVI